MADRDPELSSVLLVDLGGAPASDTVAAAGPLGWDDVAEAVGHFAGRAHTGPDGTLAALFPIPGDAVRCGEQISAAHGARCCVHVGEVSADGRFARGRAVEVAAGHLPSARAGEVLVTRTVTELCAGSGLRFRPHAAPAGGPDETRLSVLDTTAPAGPPPPARPDRVEPAARASGPRLLVVDDHPLWRQTLAKVIESKKVGSVVGQAGDAAAAFASVEQHRPDVVVMDVHLPDESGVAATRRIVDGFPETRVLMLSSSDEPEDVLAAVNAGASGYLLKTAESRDIADAVRRVAAGELVFPPAVATVVLDALRERARDVP
jgi:CheY-like chemotaxis protein